MATTVVKQMILQGHGVRGCRVTVLGLCFKQNVSNIRNSKVIDLVRELRAFGRLCRCVSGCGWGGGLLRLWGGACAVGCGCELFN